jgi:hypothetical protein
MNVIKKRRERKKDNLNTKNIIFKSNQSFVYSSLLIGSRLFVSSLRNLRRHKRNSRSYSLASSILLKPEKNKELLILITFNEIFI